MFEREVTLTQHANKALCLDDCRRRQLQTSTTITAIFAGDRVLVAVAGVLREYATAHRSRCALRRR